MGRRNSKRSKVELYAQILEVVTHYPEGIRITRLSYAVGVPVDRLKLLVERLCAGGLARRFIDEGEVFFGATQRGLEFLDTYSRMEAFLGEFGAGS